MDSQWGKPAPPLARVPGPLWQVRRGCGQLWGRRLIPQVRPAPSSFFSPLFSCPKYQLGSMKPTVGSRNKMGALFWGEMLIQVKVGRK